MEKTLRVLGGDEDAHGHGHSHSQPHVSPEVIKNSSIKGSATEDGPRSRNKTATNGISSSPEIPTTTNGPSKLSAYLNLFGDFVHNMSVLKTFLLSLDDLILSTVQMDWREYRCDNHSHYVTHSSLIQDGRILLRLPSYRCNYNFGLFRP